MADSRLNPLYLGKEEIMIAIGCDQGGFALKQELMAYLDKKGYKYKDFGSYSEASVDYPEYARKVCAAINDGICDKGILICGTGIGISIAANKIKGIRAALCTDCFMAEATRLHNDANVLALKTSGPLTPKCVNSISPSSLYKTLPLSESVTLTFLRESPCSLFGISEPILNGTSEG